VSGRARRESIFSSHSLSNPLGCVPDFDLGTKTLLKVRSKACRTGQHYSTMPASSSRSLSSRPALWCGWVPRAQGSSRTWVIDPMFPPSLGHRYHTRARLMAQNDVRRHRHRLSLSARSSPPR
jgi:hypothetical protein